MRFSFSWLLLEDCQFTSKSGSQTASVPKNLKKFLSREMSRFWENLFVGANNWFENALVQQLRYF